MQKKVLVAGATGYLGRHLVRELKNQGYWVRALIRKKSQEALFTEIDDLFCGEATKPETLSGITKNIDIVISTIGITRQKEGLTYMDVDYQGNLNILREAQKHGIERFQYISAINGDKHRNLEIFKAKEKFVDELKQSGLNHIVMRPNGFFSDMKDFLTMAKGGRVYLFGKGEYRFNPIHGEDLAEFCINALKTDTKELTVGGPDTFTHNEIAKLSLKAWGKPAKITHLPDWIRLMLIWTLRRFTSSKTYGPIEFFLTAMADDSQGEEYGKRHLKDFFNEEVKR
jgi:uncharacterized protein YbjT (DUF2867 family)